MGRYPRQFFKRPDKKLIALVIGAWGVVYGDIGTGPLYAINEIFFGQEYPLIGAASVLGPISLVIWSLTLLISLKYLSFVLRADHDGQGGVFALYGRLHQFRNKYIYYLKILLLLAAGLLIGEGIITPAISVISAVEGLAIYHPGFSSKIIPITLAILSALFLSQSKGTNSLGKVFGLVAMVWFSVIACLGFIAIYNTPSILHALNPYWAFKFLSEIRFHQAMALFASVLLVITGGEALFADMGHFGRKAIRIGWFTLVYPALLLNYLGQGAYLLSGKLVVNNNLFYSMVPKDFLLPAIILATTASVIASQALISGAFSLASQAVALGFFPRIKVAHTHHEHEGQIYVGVVNWILFIGSVILVLTFKKSSALAAAYGLSLIGVMISTTLAMIATAHLIWKWSWKKSLIIFVPILCIEVVFLAAKSVKFFEGGFIPLLIGIFIFCVMRIWKWGRKATLKAYQEQEQLTIKELIEIKNKQLHCIDKNVVLLVLNPLRSLDDKAPSLVQLFYNRYGLFPKNLFLIEVVHRKIPYIHGQRHESFVFYKGPEKGLVVSTTIHFGFMEEPNLELVLDDLALSHEIELPTDRHKWLIHTALENLIPKKRMNFWEKLRFKVFIFLRQVTMPAYFYYGLGHELNLSVDIMPINLNDKS